MFGLLSNFILQEEIKTSAAKAKEVKNCIDRIINKSKVAEDPAKKFIAVRYLDGRISKSAIKKITGEFIKNFSKRKSGYARVIKLGARKGDGSEMAVIKFV
jgi:large subunit ribosomal protein L17